MKVSGVGIGLRWEFLEDLLTREAQPSSDELPIDFLEISPENYVGRGGYYPAALRRLSANPPDGFSILTHGLTMSLGGSDPLDETYLRELRAFIRDVRAPWHSDHLCFSTSGGAVLHDLLPVRFTKKSAEHVADRVRRAQDSLGVPMAVENISFYTDPGPREMDEPEWISLVCDRADCGLMLDVNNAYVNSQNFGFDVDAWMRNAPLERTVQMHVAGHERFQESDFIQGASGSVILDTHGADVPDPVLSLLERVLPRTGDVPIVLERDQNFPPFAELMNELRRIREIRDRVLKRRE